MPYRVTPSDPQFTFDPMLLEAQAAQVAKTNGWADQAAWDAAINALTAGSAGELAVVKALARCIRVG